MSIEPTSMLIFRNGSIGNTLAAVPAMRALHSSYPKAHITVVVDPVGHTLLKYCPWINRLIVYDKRGRDRGMLAHINLIRDLRSVHPSHAVLFKRFFRNGLLSYLSGAAVRAGFETEGKAPFLTVTIPYDSTCSIVELNLRLAQKLGATSADRHLEMFLAPEDRAEAERILNQHSLLHAPFALAHYGGLTTPPDYLSISQFAEAVRQAVGDIPVLLIGHGPQESRWAELLGQSPGRFLPICGIPLRTTAALLERARLFVGFNSGPAHLAAAMRTRSIILFRGDQNAESEILKWCPPSELSLPVTVPLTSGNNSWNGFLARVRDCTRLLQNKPTDHVQS